MHPPQYDLLAIASELRLQGRQPALVDAIERASHAASAHEDLREARSCLILLQALTCDESSGPLLPKGELSTLAGALFAHSIILYARATDTPPIDRKPWFGRSKLSLPDRATHKRVMDLRNKTFAHFGRASDMPEGPMVKEALVLRLYNNQPVVAFYASRVQNRAALVPLMLDLVETVLGLAKSASLARFNEIGSEWNAAALADPTLIETFRNRLFDPTAFFVAQGAQAEIDRGMGADGSHTLTSIVRVPDAGQR